MNRIDKILIIAIVAVASFFITGAAMAEGDVYTGTTKTVNCDDATQRSDGTALAASEIDKVEIYVRTAPQASPEHTMIMTGGCKAMTLNLTTLAEGQKYMDGSTFDTAGRVSVLSVPQVPFVYQLSNPNPPSGLVITD